MIIDNIYSFLLPEEIPWSLC